jgi:hypothetical protein
VKTPRVEAAAPYKGRGVTRRRAGQAWRGARAEHRHGRAVGAQLESDAAREEGDDGRDPRGSGRREVRRGRVGAGPLLGRL